MPAAVRVTAHPSLALIKYWGKSDHGINIPATPSLAVTLGALSTITEITAVDTGLHIELDGKEVSTDSFRPFFQAFEELSGKPACFKIRSRNTFPSSAGLASSSSGFAALAVGCSAVSGVTLSPAQASRLARIGSGSAARAVFPGFTVLRAGAEEAEPLKNAAFWPELRIGIGIVRREAKKTGSRSGMNSSRLTSPFYSSWLEESSRLMKTGRQALLKRDLDTLGETMRRSYLAMFATMFSSDPPLIYWKPESVALIHALEELRSQGLSVWETMDAGPQVKFICREHDLSRIIEELTARVPGVDWLTSEAGGAPEVQEIEIGEKSP